MNAWSQIEEARYHHKTEEYNKSKVNYSKASKFLESSKSWNYISSIYLAWAEVEEAEELSRKDNSSDAKNMFQKSIDSFQKGKKTIQTKKSLFQSKEETMMASKLVETSNLKIRYCEARIDIETAKEFFGNNVTIVQYPVNSGPGFNAIIDVLTMKMYKFPSGGGKPEILDIPADQLDHAN